MKAWPFTNEVNKGQSLRGCVSAPSCYDPPDVGKWSVSRCSSMMMSSIVLKDEHAVLFDGDEFPKELKVGYEYPCSLHLVRAIPYPHPKQVWFGEGDPPAQDPQIVYDACRLHIGRWAIRNGQEYVITCSRPAGGTRKYAWARTFISEFGKKKLKPIKPKTKVLSFRAFTRKTVKDSMLIGYEYDMTSYETPWVTEVLTYSDRIYCGGVR